MTEDSNDSFFRQYRREVEEYIQDRFLLLKLQVSEKIARMVALFFSLLLFGVIIFFILLFLSIMAGYYFADITGNLYTGFGLVTLLYFLVLIIFIVTRKSFNKKISNSVISAFFEKNNEEDEKP